MLVIIFFLLSGSFHIPLRIGEVDAWRKPYVFDVAVETDGNFVYLPIKPTLHYLKVTVLL